jgi:serine/threonine-protein kinase
VVERNSGVTAATDVVELGRGPARDAIIADKYRVETTLGFGGMGVVIAARHLQLDERVAIKLLRDDVSLDAEHVERFLREAQAAVRLKSEHVARIQDVGTLPDGKPFMVMELLEGLDLGRILQDQGQLPRPAAVDLVLQACDAIAEAHSIGIVHRDLKPTNLFVTHRRDGSPLLKVLDFGISKAQSTAELSLTQTSSMLGTPAYMSPEQMRSARNADARSDIWSLGTVLYELVEGDTPFSADNFAELCVAVATEAPRAMTNAPELAPILAHALAKSPDDRFPSIAELALALEPFSSDPTRARRQVARIFRVLGKPAPAGRDATPTPTPRRDATPSKPTRGSAPELQRGSTPAMAKRDSAAELPNRDSAAELARASTFNDETSTVARTLDFAPRRRRHPAWHYVLPVVLLATAAAAAVIVLGAETHDEPATVKMNATPPATLDAAEVATGSAAIATPAGSDTGSAGSDAGSDAATAGSDAASGSDATPPPAPLPHPPPHHTPRPVPHHTPRPTATPHTSAPAATPPQPKCDPFANPKGCK